jgi:hypothetical protein
MIPIHYTDLVRYDNYLSLYDKRGKDTHWISVLYKPDEAVEIHNALKQVYALLKAAGDMNVINIYILIGLMYANMPTHIHLEYE